MSALLEVEGLSARYGRVPAVNGVDLTLERGSIVSIVGPNGAGKSTLLNALMGLHGSGCSGRIRLAGAPVEHLAAETRLRMGLCIVPEKRELFPSMSVADNLLLGAYVHRGRGRADLSPVFDRFPRLGERRAQIAGTLSGGERQMLAIGRALMARPTVLMLDEPSLGLAPRIVSEMFRVITDLRDAGVSILLVEQNARAALAISDRAYVLELGSVVLAGTGAELMGDRRVIDAYLGLAGHENAGIGEAVAADA